MTALPRIMSTLAAGLLAIGLLIGFGNQLGDCGSAFNGEKGSPCAEFRADHRPFPMALIGFGLALLAASLVAEYYSVKDAAVRNASLHSAPGAPE